MITQRAFLLGFVAFCFYLIAIVNDLAPFYYLLTWLSVGILVSSLGIALLSLIGLKCDWRLTQANVAEATEADPPESGAVDEILHGPRLEIELANNGSLSKTGVLIVVVLERDVPAAASETPKDAEELVRRRFLIEALPAGDSLRTELVLRHLPRGRYRLKDLRLIGSDVLGLFNITRRLSDHAHTPEERELLVGPSTIAWGGGVPELFRQAAREGRGATRLRGYSNDVRATRPYVPGDDLRHVHWKTTARRRELVVKEYERAAELAPCLIIWDGAAYAHRGQDGDSTLEWSLRLAASLYRIFTDNGRDCGVLRLDGRSQILFPGGINPNERGRTVQNNAKFSVSHEPNGKRSTQTAANTSEKYKESILNEQSTLDGKKISSLYPPSSSAEGRVIELFADAVADRNVSLSEAIETFLPGWPGGVDVYLLTPSLSPDVARVVHQLRLKSGRVTVGLINGSLFHSMEPVSVWKRFLRATRSGDACEYWPRVEVSNNAGSASTNASSSNMALSDTAAGSALVNEESYGEQLQRIRAQGAQAVLVPETGTVKEERASSKDEGNVSLLPASALSFALSRMLNSSTARPELSKAKLSRQ